MTMRCEARRTSRAAIAALLLATSAVAQRAGDRLAAGTWGGDGALLLVGAESATTEFDCAYGATSAPVVFGEDREFEVGGWIVDEVGKSAQEERQAAVFSGRLRRDVLTLRVRYGSPSKELGPFQLRQGGQARIKKC